MKTRMPVWEVFGLGWCVGGQVGDGVGFDDAFVRAGERLGEDLKGERK